MFNISVFSSFRNSNLKNFKKLNKIYIYIYKIYLFFIIQNKNKGITFLYLYIHKRNIIRNNKNTKVKNIFTKDFQRVKKRKEHFTKFFFTKVNNILQKLEIFEKARKYFQKLKTFYRSLKEKSYYISKKINFP